MAEDDKRRTFDEVAAEHGYAEPEKFDLARWFVKSGQKVGDDLARDPAYITGTSPFLLGLVAQGAQTIGNWLGSTRPTKVGPDHYEVYATQRPQDILAPTGLGLAGIAAGAVPKAAVGSMGGKLPRGPHAPGDDFWSRVKPLDAELRGVPAQAIDEWVGVPHNARERGIEGGLMMPQRLEGMPPEALKELGAPIQQALRDLYGDTVVAYRGDLPGAGQSTGRENKLFSYSTDRDVAARFAGSPTARAFELTPEEAIVRAERELAEKGEATVAGVTYRREPEGGIGVYKGAGMEYDVPSIRDHIGHRNAYLADLNAEREKALAGVREVRIPTDQVVWATDRAGQKEIIAPLFADQQRASLPGVVVQGLDSLPMDEASRMARAREMGFDTDARYYHGTASDFDAFDKARFGSATGADSARKAAWFVSDPTTAAGYARYAAEDAPVRKLMEQADTYERLAQKTGSEKWWDKQNDAVVRAEALEKELRESGAPGQRVIPAHLRGNFAEHDMSGAEFVDATKEINRLLREAQTGGYDGVKLHNLADDVGLNNRPATHVAVFDPKNVRSPWAAFDPSRSDSANLLAAEAAGRASMPGVVVGGLEDRAKALGLPTTAYHGTRSDFPEFKVASDNYMLDRGLGVHFAKDPEVSNSFVMERVNGREVGPKEGGRVIAAKIPDEKDMLVAPQDVFPGHLERGVPLYKSVEGDQFVIERMIMDQAYRRDPDMLARYLVQARAVPEDAAPALAQSLSRGEVVDLPHDGSMDLPRFLKNFGGKPYNDADRARATDLAREAWQEQGYKGLRYINTAPMEMATAKDPTSYIVFDPKHARARYGAAFDPAKIDSANLLSGRADVSVPGVLGLRPEESEAETPLEALMRRYPIVPE